MGEILASNIFETLSQNGIKIYSDQQDGIELKIHPHYHNNFGFFHVVTEEYEFIILKGLYQDNTRNIRNKHPLSSFEINTLIDTIFKAERVVNAPLLMDIYLCEDNCYVKNAEIVQEVVHYDDARDYTIPRPLSSNEYSEPKSRMYDEEIILSSSYFATYFPQVLSHLSSSIFNEVLDILNPIFVSCNLKTTSPSIVPLYGRLYINLTGFEKMMHTIGLNKSLYRRTYAPNLFLKMGYSKLDKLNRNFFPVTFEEIKEVLESIKESIDSLDANMVSNKSFYDYIVQMVIVYEYLSIEFMNNLSTLLKKYPNISLVLNAVYKTRNNSIFYSEEEFLLPKYMDFESPVEKVVFNVEKKVDKMKIHMKRFSIFSRTAKLKKAIKNMHKLLDMRDELYLTASKFIVKSKDAFKNLTEIGINKNKLVNENDIYYLDHDEIRRMLKDTLFFFFFDIICFRKWRNKRYAAQVMPPEIYGFDISDTPHIAEDMIIKYKEREAFAAYGLNRIECSGKIETNLNLEDYSNKIIAAYNLPVTKLNNYKTAKGLLVENISPFSLAAEFAVLNNIPLWTGVRFGSLFLKNINIKKNTLFQIDEQND